MASEAAGTAAPRQRPRPGAGPGPGPGDDAAPVADPAAAVLSCEGLHKAYGDRTAVDGVSFVVRPGEAFGLLGPNGAGKTTTIRMICGLVRPDAGIARVAGVGLGGRGGRSQRAALGYVPQDLALFPTLTLRENLVFWARMQGLHRRERRDRVEEVLASVALGDRADDRVDQTSGGMQRRLNLAVALLHRPPLLLLDEPTVGIDPQSRASLLDRLRALRDDGVAVLYTSHYMDEVQRLCDRVAIMDQGRLIALGRPDELLATHGADDLEALFLALTGRGLRD